ncbi:MAG: hypothetical protein M1828_005308 [Chrysothrix sp. TS-e1954]|nr:MAG: hypothetical protein M1828_005308 [Chrysothrix sp. TS-e1954]
MALTNYKEYLAAQIIAESSIVSYRQLSRHLKVPVNTAKRMLYAFHASQNTRKPGSIHAVYLLSSVLKPQISPNISQPTVNGTSQRTDGEASEDTTMHDSFPSSSLPLPSSMPSDALMDGEGSVLLEDVVKVTTIQMVAEKDLESAKDRFETLSCIHIYALSPAPVQDLQILTDCNRKVMRATAAEDKLESWKTYGTIHNSLAQRRTTRIQPQVQATVAAAGPPVTAAMKGPAEKGTVVKQTAAKAELNSKAKPTSTAAMPEKPRLDAKDSRSNSRPTSRDSAKPAPAATKKSGLSSLKRQSSSNISSAFAKTPAPKPKEAAKEDTMMHDDDEGDDALPDATPQPSAETLAKTTAAKRAKAEREEGLRAMMDASPSPSPTSSNSIAHSQAAEDEPMPDVPSPAPAPAAESAQDENTTTSAGRRRGRRKVLKKKTTKDAEGYLVTSEEAVWESFSEDETAPAARKGAPAGLVGREKGSAGGSGETVSGKGGKAAGAPSGKVGQGNIRSFFKKG